MFAELTKIRAAVRWKHVTGHHIPNEASSTSIDQRGSNKYEHAVEEALPCYPSGRTRFAVTCYELRIAIRFKFPSVIP